MPGTMARAARNPCPDPCCSGSQVCSDTRQRTGVKVPAAACCGWLMEARAACGGAPWFRAGPGQWLGLGFRVRSVGRCRPEPAYGSRWQRRVGPGRVSISRRVFDCREQMFHRGNAGARSRKMRAITRAMSMRMSGKNEITSNKGRRDASDDGSRSSALVDHKRSYRPQRPVPPPA